MKATALLIGALGLLAAAPGCTDRSEDKGGQRVAALRAGYADCRRAAGDEAQALLRCADDAVRRAVSLDAPADQPLARREMVRLGDALLARMGRADGAARVLAADRLAHYAFDRAALPACRAPSAPACTAARAALEQRLLQRRASPGAAAAPAVGAGAPPAYSPPSCDAVAKAGTTDAVLQRFETDFPAALKDERLVETIMLDDSQVRSTATYLACVAARTDFGPDVAETSLWFFASKRYGARALAALDAAAAQGDRDGAAARMFAAQIRGYLNPEP